ncbi:polyribonucleotide nucleotidyltransferase [Candidatus Desantisbacteria bacterium CG_4_10_14_0_8_um_filter_48_22]|uniref:Polyribonucleotide nucleotidyltransferase n=1 Tax=Candidatus Desantisbacteria bacterium CG_4_10_14_0_8_um_filter_48_22 TaxID=1974543 RepID=A0A2M7SCS0_9BACT|nr:MAG: polyribonucleotide nucleotidyltransferase [Candidatus Desantisbacteria bacterium CG1_02_49_89]PIZ17269.1 MAG: polyribonucleotide nucleotidyltransferase [Candidatus Desantisbacteria bacterium CG_4_10_14_0_8_um_filter_48_22]
MEDAQVTEEIEVGGRKLIVSTGKMAKQAHGSVTLRYGDTVVLVTAVMSPEARKGIDFLPLLVDYREKAYSVGKIPGGFFKREGRPTEKETVNSRMIDRSIRPLFKENVRNDIQIIASVLSMDQINKPDVLGIMGASCALAVSGIPFDNLIGAVRIGKVGGNLVVNPTYQDLAAGSELDMIVTATKDRVVMIEAGAKEIPEEDLVRGIELAMEQMGGLVRVQENLAKKAGKAKKGFITVEATPELDEKVRSFLSGRLEKAISVPSRNEREESLRNIQKAMKAELCLAEEEEPQAKMIFEEMLKNILRKMILSGKRIDGRGFRDIRPITCETGVLPRTHGSALFTRGETQSLVVTTLGSMEDRQIIDDIELETEKKFMLHYNFPAFSTGEVKPERGAGRREIGHGALAEKAVSAVLPSEEEFPYTVRLVSDILESNGSSSMATVCGSSLSLMDAGVPIKRAVAGIAMGLVREGGNTAILSDIAGMEDHYGDMDFKVAGTEKGVSALQLDLKITGVETSVLKEILAAAREGRLFILGKMNEVISKARATVSTYAPKIYIYIINPKKIGELIGPGGKMIRSIIDQTGAEIDVDDDGKVMISCTDEKNAMRALDLVKSITAEVEVGKIYKGRVMRVMDFGAFVEILPGKEGLVHVSQFGEKRVEDIRKVVKEGDEFDVKVTEIDSQGRINLSRKQALREKKDA